LVGSRVRLGLIAGTLAVMGCEPGSSGATGPTVTDSAGVRFVAHRRDVEPPRFEMDSTALLRLGVEPDTVTLFGVLGGALLPGGDVLVADGRNFRLVRWSPDGVLRGTFGGQGDGPGEFQNMTWMQVTEAGVAVHDARLRRVTWLDPDGTLLRTTPFSVDPPEPPSGDAIIVRGGPLGVLGGGSMVGYDMAWADPRGEEGPLPMYADVAVFDSISRKVHPVGRFELLEQWEDPTNARFPIANRLEMPRIHWAARGDLLAITDAVGYRVDLLEGGRRATVVTEDRSRVPFEPDSLPAGYQVAADSLQAYRDVRIDGRRRIWVEPAVAEGTATRAWRVFDLDGTLVGALALPADAVVLDATDDRILLLRRSEYDEESVEVRELRTP
jgi:hypothetical protein